MTRHELYTNAVKYGPLSNETGKVVIAWEISTTENLKTMMKFSWREEDGPPMSLPTAKGLEPSLLSATGPKIWAAR